MRDLAEVLREVLPPNATHAARRAADVLRQTYRSAAPPRSLAIAGPQSAAAYAAYRMPATHAALGAALDAALGAALDAALDAGPGELGPGRPDRLDHLDLGGGTGAAVWAVHDRWPGRVHSTVLDASEHALSLGSSLAGRGDDATLAQTRWDRMPFDASVTLPPCDLATIGYLLGELAPEVATALVNASLRAARAVLVVEPGTPRGYAAVLAARDLVLEAGWRIIAPCPHALACPLAAGDWCHFSVRVQRSSLHRQLKDAELGHEDEKFSYLYAVAPPVAPGSPVPRVGEPVVADAEARVLRHPLQRKGLVQLRVCRPDGTTGDALISKRQGSLYKRARDTKWGDTIPLPG